MIFISATNRPLWKAGLYVIPAWKLYPTLYFCKSLQTTTYEVVNGSYVPTSQTKQEKETKVFLGMIIVYLV
jgi:hypothetical protein